MKLYPLKAKLLAFNILKMGKLQLPGRDGSYPTRICAHIDYIYTHKQHLQAHTYSQIHIHIKNQTVHSSVILSMYISFVKMIKGTLKVSLRDNLVNTAGTHY